MAYALQISDKYKRAIPANWPVNELFGDELIIPPASKYDEAMKRLESDEYSCLDWWICHDKPLSEAEVRKARELVGRV